MRCLVSARFNMLLDVLRPASAPTTSSGNWNYVQDPDSGALQHLWLADDLSTPLINEGLIGVNCLVRGIVSPGARGSGNTQMFNAKYENIEFVKITFPASVNITKRDRITNIRDSNGNILWIEEEANGSPATIFEVKGITPVINPFGKHVENGGLLTRAEVQ